MSTMRAEGRRVQFWGAQGQALGSRVWGAKAWEARAGYWVKALGSTIRGAECGEQDMECRVQD